MCIIKSLIPPVFLNILKKIKSNKYGWQGDYKTWADAQSESVGYDTDDILNKVRCALIKIRNGEATYERDSVLFDEIEYSWPLLAGLMYITASSKGCLRVLDFGGSLGSSYYQNKKFLDNIENFSWNIVEQKHFVEVGKKDFETDQLKFFYTIKECVNIAQPNVLLLSSVLQYIEKPYELLNSLLRYHFDYILMDRTIFNKEPGADKITVQTVPLENYSSIPSWLFEEKKMKDFISLKYHLIEEFELKHETRNNKYEKGFIWQKIKI